MLKFLDIYKIALPCFGHEYNLNRKPDDYNFFWGIFNLNIIFVSANLKKYEKKISHTDFVLTNTINLRGN